MLTKFGLLILVLPALGAEYSTYIGDNYPYHSAAITTDAAGNAYIAGSRLLSPPASTDVFLTKLDPNGSLVFTVALGGKGIDTSTSIVLDPAGKIYVAGSSTSLDFPLSKALQKKPNSGGSGFIVKFSPDGGTILYSTWFGGTLGASSIAAVATDAQGNLYVAGSTYASDFPVTRGMPDARGNVGVRQGAFVAKISPGGDNILYGGLLAGTALPLDCHPTGDGLTTAGVGIGVDGSGNAYLVGNTDSTDLPVSSEALVKQGVGAFVAKINSAGTSLDFLTYLDAADDCGGAKTTASAIAVDAAGNAYVAGMTVDPKFSVTAGVVQPVFGGLGFLGGDAFVSVLPPDGKRLEWSTFLGGAGRDAAQSIAVDAAGVVWLSGSTTSSEFPNANGEPKGTEFLVGISRGGSRLVYSALYHYGGVAVAVAVGPVTGLVYTAGAAGTVAAISTTIPPSPRIFGVVTLAKERVLPDFVRGYGIPLGGSIAAGELISIYGRHIGPAAEAYATFDSAGVLPTTLAGVAVTVGGLRAPLIYVSEGRIDAIVPMRAPAGLADIAIASVTPHFRSVVVPAAPAIFANPDGTAAALNQDGTVNSRDNAAPPGSIVSLWATGTGPTFGSLNDGQLTVLAVDNCVGCLVNISRFPSPSGDLVIPSYGGSAPGIVAGVTQINVAIPLAVGSSSIAITLNVGGATDTVLISVQSFFPF